MLKPHAHRPDVLAQSSRRSLASPASTTRRCCCLARNGFDIGAEALARDWRETPSENSEVMAAWKVVYGAPEDALDALRAGRKAGRLRGLFPPLALQPRHDGRAHHRAQARHRRHRPASPICAGCWRSNCSRNSGRFARSSRRERLWEELSMHESCSRKAGRSRAATPTASPRRGRSVFVGGQVGWNGPEQKFETDDFVGQGQADAGEHRRHPRRGRRRARAHHLDDLVLLSTSRSMWRNLKGIGQAYREVIGRHFPAMAAMRGGCAGRGSRQGRDPGQCAGARPGRGVKD